jgi:ATP-dependent Clp protease ATP-binding subunit ClpB
MQLEIEKQALQKEKDQPSLARLEKIKAELADLEEKSKALTAQWQAEKEAIQGYKDLKAKLDQAQLDMERAERSANLEEASRLRYGTIRELESKIHDAEAKLQTQQKQGALLKEEVDAEEIATVVAKWTGIPVNRLMEGEMEKLLRMEERLHQRVVGQEEAINAVSNAVRRSRSGMQDPNRPIGSFIFLGPTGVGKTELARALAEFLFDDQNALVRIDMSEYQERHTISRLFGAPPGYVGYEEGGQLTEAVRRRPYSVVLFDEIEKAHSEIFNALLQVLDDGRMTDGQGRTVDFRNTLIIMTSNLGSQLWMHDEKDQPKAVSRDEIVDLLKNFFRPEFLNRVDEIVVFKPLTRENLGEIVSIQLRHVSDLLAERGLRLEISPAASEWLADAGYDPEFGARPLKRAIQREVQDPLALKILSGAFREGDTIKIDLTEDHLSFTKA